MNITNSNVCEMCNTKLDCPVKVSDGYWETEHSFFNLRYSVLHQIPIVFYNDSNYDFHLMRKHL